jgi:hypothetical protein
MHLCPTILVHTLLYYLYAYDILLNALPVCHSVASPSPDIILLYASIRMVDVGCCQVRGGGAVQVFLKTKHDRVHCPVFSADSIDSSCTRNSMYIWLRIRIDLDAFVGVCTHRLYYRRSFHECVYARILI